jgi:hypothetical protein
MVAAQQNSIWKNAKPPILSSQKVYVGGRGVKAMPGAATPPPGAAWPGPHHQEVCAPRGPPQSRILASCVFW